MPLTRIQSRALLALAASRDPESYVAGSTPLNRTGPRYSADIDIFHDRAERVAQQAQADAATLLGAGFAVRWVRQTAFVHVAAIEHTGEATKLEWVADSDFRYFPTVADPVFGYRLHPVDLAINKVFAAAGRSEPRDILDLSTIEQTVAPLSALIWAGVDKSPGFTPEGLIAQIRRHLVHPLTAWQQVATAAAIDPADITRHVSDALDRAAVFARRMPTTKMGLVFLDRAGTVVEPDPARLDDCVEHRGRTRGHWPGDGDILDAMLGDSKPGQLP
jgi:hypothetical protein